MFERAVEQLVAAYREAEARRSPAALEERRQQFMAEYPPERLSRLRGEELLRVMHGAGPREGLFYQLEFGPLGEGFGSVAGGSSLKFKVYRAQDGQWKKKGSGNYPVACSEEEALRITGDLVAQLALGLDLADRLGLERGEREAWAEFEGEVGSQAPVYEDEGVNSPVLDLGWAHKYLAMARPQLFSFHHHPRYLARHLVRLGVLPEGRRYVHDWQWRSLRLGDPRLSALDPAVLMSAAFSEAAFGTGANYWRVGTTEDDKDRWPAMHREAIISIGWAGLGDLGELLAGLSGESARQRLKDALRALGEPEGALGGKTNQIRSFFAEMQPGDRVVAMRGRTVRGIGLIEGDYVYTPGSSQPHQRRARWLSDEEWEWTESYWPQGAVYNFTDRSPDALRLEERLAGAALPPLPPPPAPPAPAIPLSALEAQVQAILWRKGQVILYGPPGTGKTYQARRAAQEIIARSLFPGGAWPTLTEPQRQEVEGRITHCTFHPAYAYEDFIEGYRPVPPAEAGGAASFELRDGCFLRLCERARAEPRCPHLLIIDEINRGNVPAILGELITLLEADKRETHATVLPLSRRRFSVPRNVWIIGTMNTADRSISLLDAALRRRFGFLELLPQPANLDCRIDALPLGTLLAELNQRIRRLVPRNARGLQIGHAYFMQNGQPITTRDQLLCVMRDDVIPLLEDYCFESYSLLAEILSEEIVDSEAQCLQAGVVDDAERLYRALLCLVSPSLEQLPANDDPEAAAGSDDAGEEEAGR